MNCKSTSSHYYKQAYDFHSGSLYANLNDKARSITESLALCFESDNDVLRIEETQVAFVAVYDSLAEIGFWQLVENSGHVSASSKNSVDAMLIVLFA